MTNQQMAARARARIPGGTQLLSKRPELFAPELWPGYYTRAKGAECWDLEGNRYLDMSITGVGSCALGFADEDVDNAVKEAIDNGAMCTLNCPEEIELADLLCELHPWAEMARYSRSGGEALVIAVRIARAYTRRAKVAFCGYHGWHDWYLAANLAHGDILEGHLLPGLDPSGVPPGLTGTALPFHYNQTGELAQIANDHGSDLAAIVMEPCRSRDPDSGFLETVREIANRTGAVLIFDEVTSGLRMNCGGIHLKYGVNPDIAVFAKAISNGYPMGAVLGTGRVMQTAQDSFISSTAWTERIGPVAALATIKKHRERNVSAHLIETGVTVQGIWKEAANRFGLDISVTGIPPLSHLGFNHPNPQAYATLFTQEMLKRGILAGKAFYACYAHTRHHLGQYRTALTDAFGVISEAVIKGDVESRLDGPVAHAGFYRLT